MGTNQGVNLKVLHEQLPEAELHGVEINQAAAERARRVEGVCSITQGSLLSVEVERTFNLAFTAGVLSHLAPDTLGDAYAKLCSFSRRYVLISEYHNPRPEEIVYRGHSQRLFKRDYAGELLDACPELQLLDYGFFYHRDPRYGLGDINWFLMEKRAG